MIPWSDDLESEDQFMNNTTLVPVVTLGGTSDRLNFGLHFISLLCYLICSLGVTAVLTVIAISWTVSDLIPLTQNPTWIDRMANAILLIVAWSGKQPWLD